MSLPPAPGLFAVAVSSFAPPLSSLHRDRGRFRGVRLGGGGDPYHAGFGPAVQEELLNRITRFTELIEPAEIALEIRGALHPHRAVDWTLGKVIDERSDRCRDARDRVHTARDFFDIDARIADSDRHDRPLSALSVFTRAAAR